MKLLKVLLPLALCFLLLAGCGKKVELADPEDYQDRAGGPGADRPGQKRPGEVRF